MPAAPDIVLGELRGHVAIAR
ncbi:MAG: hypothetical protein QOG63_3100, partial [Thermoleophilaceae bacterium]|nr:hypothetical protein [Thermoleophilaceae bacterium]